MNAVLVPLPDGRWLALEPGELRAALTRAEGLGFGPNVAPATPPVAPAELCDSREMGRALGVADTWVEAAAKTGEIPCVRVGRYLRFDRTAVLRALANGRHADPYSATTT